MPAYRCPTCGSPLTYADGKTRVPHLSWCAFAPRPKPPVSVLTAPAPESDPMTPDELGDDHE